MHLAGRDDVAGTIRPTKAGYAPPAGPTRSERQAAGGAGTATRVVADQPLWLEGGIHLSQVVRGLRSDWSPLAAAVVGQAASQAVWAARRHVSLESMVPPLPPLGRGLRIGGEDARPDSNG